MDDNVGNSINAQGGYDRRQLADNKSENYSPSVSFNYGGNHGGQTGSKKSGSNAPRSRQQGSNQGKRSNQNKHKSNNSVNPNQTEKLIRQNDSIIRLLKEIRDRLPEPPKIEKPKKAEKAVSPEKAEQVDSAEKAEKKRKIVRKQRVYRFENDEAVVKNSVEDDTKSVENTIEKEELKTDVQEVNIPVSETPAEDGNSAPTEDAILENAGNETKE